MILLAPKAAEHEAFSSYGTFYDLLAQGEIDTVIRSTGDGFLDSYMKQPLIDRPGNLGMTCACAVPATIEKMEMHLHTQEAIMCAGEPVAFLVAPAGGDAPAAQDVQSFTLNPGQVVILNRGIWHSPAFGICGPASYYWMAEAYEGEPTIWKAIEGGPVQLACPLAEE